MNYEIEIPKHQNIENWASASLIFSFFLFATCVMLLWCTCHLLHWYIEILFPPFLLMWFFFSSKKFAKQHWHWPQTLWHRTLTIARSAMCSCGLCAQCSKCCVHIFISNPLYIKALNAHLTLYLISLSLFFSFLFLVSFVFRIVLYCTTECDSFGGKTKNKTQKCTNKGRKKKRKQKQSSDTLWTLYKLQLCKFFGNSFGRIYLFTDAWDFVEKCNVFYSLYFTRTLSQDKGKFSERTKNNQHIALIGSIKQYLLLLLLGLMNKTRIPTNSLRFVWFAWTDSV